MIGLSTTLGQQMLRRTSAVNDLMVERFTNQVNRTFCGPASLAVLINALNLAYRIKYTEVQGDGDAEKSFFNQAEAGGHFRVSEDDVVNVHDVKEYLKANTDIYKSGLNMLQLENITNLLGFGVNVYFACGNGLCDDPQIKSKLESIVRDPEYILKNSKEFREFAKDYIKRPVTGVIANYNMSMLGYDELKGHFSPLAAYDEESDRFLVMDVWPDTPPAWVKTEDLFNAMSSVDSDSHLPRGLLHIHELLF